MVVVLIELGGKSGYNKINFVVEDDVLAWACGRIDVLRFALGVFLAELG